MKRLLRTFLIGTLPFVAVAAGGCAPSESEDGASSNNALATSSAVSSTIYGVLITDDDKPYDATLTVTCANAQATTTTSSEEGMRGSFLLTVKDRGRCHLVINDMAQPGELVFLYDEPTRYDYLVEGTGAATHLVRR